MREFVRVGGACSPPPARGMLGVLWVGGACSPPPARGMLGVLWVGGACSPPPPVAAALVPRCALLPAATPRLMGLRQHDGPSAEVHFRPGCEQPGCERAGCGQTGCTMVSSPC